MELSCGWCCSYLQLQNAVSKVSPWIVHTCSSCRCMLWSFKPASSGLQFSFHTEKLKVSKECSPSIIAIDEAVLSKEENSTSHKAEVLQPSLIFIGQSLHHRLTRSDKQQMQYQVQHMYSVHQLYLKVVHNIVPHHCHIIIVKLPYCTWIHDN